MNILVIEDDLNIQMILSVFLESLGYKTLQATNRVSAEKLIKNEKYDIILADYMLPDGTGLDLLKIIKESDPFAIVIFLTAYDDKSLLVKLINSGAYAYLSKPFDFEDLEISINKALEYKKLLEENFKLSKELIEKKEFEKELRLGEEIQNNILQENFLSRVNVDVYGKISSAGFVGGDYYDVINVDNDNVMFIIGDVAGKGLKASIVMVMILSIIRTLVDQGVPLKLIMEEINETILKYTNISMHSTCFIGILNTKTFKFQYCNAGHEYPAVLRDEKIIFIEKNDIFLGAIEEQRYTLFKIQLKENDKIIFYTDGLNESIGITSLELMEKINKFFIKNNSIKNCVEEIIEYANSHVKYRDDKTLMCVCLENRLKKYSSVELRIRANTYSIKDLNIILNEIYENIKITDQEKFNINLAIQEVVNNAIQHAYLDKEGKIDIRFSLEENNSVLNVEVKDYGIGISDNLKKKLGLKIEDSFGSRGRGLFLTKSLVEDFKIESFKNKGTKINFRIKRNS